MEASDMFCGIILIIYKINKMKAVHWRSLWGCRWVFPSCWLIQWGETIIIPREPTNTIYSNTQEPHWYKLQTYPRTTQIQPTTIPMNPSMQPTTILKDPTDTTYNPTQGPHQCKLQYPVILIIQPTAMPKDPTNITCNNTQGSQIQSTIIYRISLHFENTF